MLSCVKKLTLIGMLVLVTITSLLGSLAAVAPAQAVFPVTVVESVPDKTKTVMDTIWTVIKTAVLNAVIRLVAYAMRKVAYDSAVWLASGGKGQSPLAQIKDFGSYLQSVGDEAFGRAVESLSEGVGMNLCKIPDVKADLAFKMGMRTGFGGLGTVGGNLVSNKPSCSFQDFQKNWLTEDAWKSKWNSNSANLTRQFNSALNNPEESDFGMQLKAMDTLATKVLGEKASQELQRLEGQGYMAKVSKISGQILTPAGVIKKDMEKNTPGDQQEKDEKQIAALLAKGDIQVLPTILSIFLNSLVSSMVKNYQEQGMLPFGICFGETGGAHCKNQPNVAAQFSDIGGVAGGRQAAQELFSGFLAVVVNTPDQYDLLGKLSSCTENPELYNCRMDQEMVQAIRQAETGKPATIREALDPKNRWLHGDWLLIPPSRLADNMDLQKVCQKAYCYGNVKVLRQVGILPVGFEIAALNSDPDHPWTLQQVVDGFNKCDYIQDQNGKIVGTKYNPAQEYQFCHLVDPNWVLKLAPTRCNAVVSGALPLTKDNPTRLEECADLTTCVAYDAKGNCSNYAYCTRTKNTWQFGADKCDAQNRTCRSFQDTAGNNVAYLYRTLDTGYCSSQTVGCAYYSLSQSGQGWQGPGHDPNTLFNNGIYFNGQLTPGFQCSAGSGGCSAFTVASSTTGEPVYLKKAPDYLGCYDSDQTDSGVQWPVTLSDLRNIKPQPACTNYTMACVQDEVGCSLFKPLSVSGADIPGKWSQENVCDGKCVGYNSFRELPSNYSGGQDLAYIVPALASACKFEEVGCSAFTNLGAVQGAGEKVENFSYLRSCVPSSLDKGKNYITYEGSSRGGFQLRTYKLVENTDPNNGPVGAPKYFYKTLDELKTLDVNCTADKYREGKSDPDCRQFNDEAGRVFYRRLLRTIPVSDSCAYYRLDATELADLPNVNQNDCTAVYKGNWNQNDNICQVCFQGGEYKDGQCYYYGLPGGVDNTAGGSRVCSASVNSCRQYNGAGSFVVKTVIPGDTFENASTTLLRQDWGPAEVFVAPESTQVKGSSLGYTGDKPITRRLPPLAIGKAYDLTFWARGAANKLTISFENKTDKYSKTFGQISLGDTWQEYRFGSLELSGANVTSSVSLQIALEKFGFIFIDNVRLVEGSDQIFLVKNSINVPLECDAKQDDNLPGAALGCERYQDMLHNQTINLTQFDWLCREGAIGCAGVFDTQNTITLKDGKVQPGDEGPRLYNVWFPGTGGAKVSVTLPNQKPIGCTIPIGQNGCYVTRLNGVEAKDLPNVALDNNLAPQLTKSTIYLPGDTPTTTPIYVVINQAATCNAVDLGCAEVGVQKNGPLGPVYETSTLKNDPAAYEQVLCQSESVGCASFASGGSTLYFKDPLVAGQAVCEYGQNKTINLGAGGVATRTGWFRKGVGLCSNNPKKMCVANTDCGDKTATCDNIGTVPCYPNYTLPDNTFGLWSFGDAGKYNNFVGSCPAEQSGCTEFVDHNNNDKAEYRIKNANLNGGECNGKVSQKFGCVLFDQTDVPAKPWSTAGTYQASEARDSSLVDPVLVGNAGGDTNIILKVQRDRECGEWLQCRSSHVIKDVISGKYKTICDQIGRCNQATPPGTPSDLTGCANWVDGKHQFTGRLLTEESYVTRGTAWKDSDFTGLSLLNQYPAEELRQVNIGTQDKADWRLVKFVACGGGVNCYNKQTPGDYKCLDKKFPCGAGNSDKCVMDASQAFGYCVQNVDGTADQEILEKLPTQFCRAYPEPDAPFPNTPAIVPAVKNISQAFTGTHYCTENPDPSSDKLKSYACECDYTKVNYGDSIVKYWKYNAPNTLAPTLDRNDKPLPNPPGICQGGKYADKACFQDSDCQDQVGELGSCSKKSNETKFLGWRGYCLEDDISRVRNADDKLHPCLTWYPVDSLLGTLDINDQHAEAGYQTPSKAGQYYCAAANGPQDPANWWQKNLDDFTPVGGPYSNMAPDGGGVINWQTRPLVKNNAEVVAALTIGSENPITRINGAYYDNGGSANEVESQILLSNVQSIILQVGKGDNEDPKPGAYFEIFPNDTLAGRSGLPQASYEVAMIGVGEGPENKTGKGTAITGEYNAHESGGTSQFILFYASDPNFLNPQTGDVCIGGSVNSGKPCRKLWGNILRGPLFIDSGNTRLNHDFGGLWQVNDNNDQAIDPARFCSEDGAADMHGGNFHAIDLVFKGPPAERRFAGFNLAYCDASPANGAVTYRIIFRMKQWCSILADAQVDYTSDVEFTAPLTNRLWQRGNFTVKDRGLNYKLADVNPAFGSLGFKSEPAVKTEDISPAAKPQKCPDPQNIMQKCSFILADKEQTSDTGKPYSPLAQNDSDFVLGNLFAKVKRLFNYSFNLISKKFTTPNPFYQTYNEYEGYIKNNNSFDYTEKGLVNPNGQNTKLTPYTPKSPQVRSLGLPCTAPDKCTENIGLNGVTINNVSQGEVKIFNSVGHVALRFFAYADSDQMPLKQIRVDWGDGNITPRKGLFRNHRGMTTDACLKLGRCDVGPQAGKDCATTADCRKGIEQYACKLATGHCSLDKNLSCDPKDPDACIVNVPNGKPPIQSRGNCILDTKKCDGGANQVCTSSNNCDFKNYNGPAPQCTNITTHRQLSGEACQPGDPPIVSNQCVPEERAPSFGLIKNITCDNEYFEFVNNYQCDNLNSNYHLAGSLDKNNQSWCPDDFKEGCCVFVPSVQVKDNWGWCNGKCSDVNSPGGEGCYDKTGVRLECQQDPGAWTLFDGKIIVAPRL